MGRFGERVLTGLIFLCLLVLAIHKVVSYDVWWQIETGEWILRNGIPRIDPFSYAFPGREWIEPRWLYCVAVHLVFQNLGLNFLILGKAALLFLVFTLLFRLGEPDARWATHLGLVLSLAVVHDRFMVRPELLSYLGLALTLLSLQRYRTGGDRRWIYALPAVQLVWNNAHTLWILGPAIQWIFLAGELAQARLAPLLPARLRRGDVLSGERRRALFVVACLSSLATLVNPYVLKGVTFPFLLFTELGSGHVLGGAIQEFLGPFSPEFFGWSYRTVVYLVAIGVSAGAFLLNLERISFSRLALWAAFVVLSVRAQRNVALFGYVAGYATILNLTEYHRARAGEVTTVSLARLANVAVVVYMGLMIPLAASDYFYRAQGWNERFGFGLSDRKHPVRALEFVRQSGLPAPVLHTLADGGYVLFEGGEKSVYVDGRLEVYGGDLLQRAFAATFAGEEVSEEARRVGARTVLVRNDSRQLLAALEADPEWVPVYFDHLHQVYLRVAPETGELVRRFSFDWQLPVEHRIERPARVAPRDWLEGWWSRVEDGFEAERLGSLFAGVGNYAGAQTYFERALEQYPGNARACLHLGLIYRAQGREDAARPLLARVPARFLDRADVNLFAGQVHLWAGNPADAARYFQRLIELDGFRIDYARRLARAAYRAERFDLAESTLRRMIELDPDSTVAWNSLALVLRQLGRRDEAIECLRTSLGIDSDQPEVYDLLATLLEELGDAQEARRLRERASALEDR